MAKQAGQHTLRGSIGNVTYYEHPFYGMAARARYGPSKERIENDPAYASVKANNNVMGMISSACSLIRKGFQPVVVNVSDSKVDRRLMKEGWNIYRAAKELDLANVFQSEAIKLLKDFSFGETPLSKIIYRQPEISKEGDAVCISVNSQMGSLKGSTHYRVVSAVCGFDFIEKRFELDVEDGGLEVIDAINTFSFTHRLKADLPIHIVVIAVLCYQYTNGAYYRMNDKECKAADVVAVYYNEA